MLLGIDFDSEVNPYAVRRDHAFPYRGLLYGAEVNCPVNVETLVLSFNTLAQGARLANLTWVDNWVGSSSGALYIRSNKKIEESFYQQWTHDTETLEFTQPLMVEVPPWSLVELSFLNQTDTANDRPVIFALSGWYLPLEVKP